MSSKPIRNLKKTKRKDNFEESKVDFKRGDKAEYFAEKISKIGLVVPVQTADKHSLALSLLDKNYEIEFANLLFGITNNLELYFPINIIILSILS